MTREKIQAIRFRISEFQKPTAEKAIMVITPKNTMHAILDRDDLFAALEIERARVVLLEKVIDSYKQSTEDEGHEVIGVTEAELEKFYAENPVGQ